jgi:hypothetical protein
MIYMKKECGIMNVLFLDDGFFTEAMVDELRRFILGGAVKIYCCLTKTNIGGCNYE